MKTERIEIRVTAEERRRYDAARGLVSLAAWLRDVANKAAEHDTKVRRREHKR